MMALLLTACAGPSNSPDSSKESTPEATETGGDDSETGAADSTETDTSGGDTDTGETAEPDPCDRSLPWTFVDAGIQQTCGIHSDGCAECWGIGEEDEGPAWDTGAYHYEGEDLPPPVPFATIDIVRDRSGWNWEPHACGVLTDGSVLCWGNSEFGMATAPPGTYTEVAVTVATSWAIRTDGTVAVWGVDAAEPPLRSVVAIEAAYGAMALTSHGELSYWNVSGIGDAIPAPTEPFTAFDFGHVFGCGINAAGDVHCWELGRPEAWETADLTVDAPAGPFVDLCVGWGGSACALREDGSLTCWSEPYDPVDLSGVPEGHVYTQVACGWQHACAVTVDGQLVCWGNDTYGETVVPT